MFQSYHWSISIWIWLCFCNLFNYLSALYGSQESGIPGNPEKIREQRLRPGNLFWLGNILHSDCFCSGSLSVTMPEHLVPSKTARKM